MFRVGDKIVKNERAFYKNFRRGIVASLREGHLYNVDVCWEDFQHKSYSFEHLWDQVIIQPQTDLEIRRFMTSGASELPATAALTTPPGLAAFIGSHIRPKRQLYLDRTGVVIDTIQNFWARVDWYGAMEISGKWRYVFYEPVTIDSLITNFDFV